MLNLQHDYKVLGGKNGTAILYRPVARLQKKIEFQFKI